MTVEWDCAQPVRQERRGVSMVAPHGGTCCPLWAPTVKVAQGPPHLSATQTCPRQVAGHEDGSTPSRCPKSSKSVRPLAVGFEGCSGVLHQSAFQTEGGTGEEGRQGQGVLRAARRWHGLRVWRGGSVGRVEPTWAGRDPQG